jgi:predicted dehydrogenase
MIGLDTSHVPAFAKLFNDPSAPGHIPGLKIVAGYPGGTDLPASKNRVAGFTEDLRKMGIEIVDSIPALLAKVDVVLLESVDGRIHLQEAIPVIKARKPVFIDKPVAGSLADAIAIYSMAKAANVPVFSASSQRYAPGIQALLKNESLGGIAGALTYGPCNPSVGMPDMFFYGIHGIEQLFALMGHGCDTVSRTVTKDTDVLTGVWADGRVGTYRGIRTNKYEYGAVAFGTKAIASAATAGTYNELCAQIVKFFQTGKAPVTPEQTLEIFTFMEAADESKRQGGAAVKLSAVRAKAEAEAKAKVQRAASN